MTEKYSPAKIAKALAATAIATLGTAITAAGGPTLDALAALPPSGWMAAVGVGLTTGAGTFATPNKTTTAAPGEQATTSIEQTWQEKLNADAAVQAITKKVDELRTSTTSVDPLAKQTIDAFRPPTA